MTLPISTTSMNININNISMNNISMNNINNNNTNDCSMKNSNDTSNSTVYYESLGLDMNTADSTPLSTARSITGQQQSTSHSQSLLALEGKQLAETLQQIALNKKISLENFLNAKQSYSNL